jgi:hypothetical protein
MMPRRNFQREKFEDAWFIFFFFLCPGGTARGKNLRIPGLVFFVDAQEALPEERI